MIKHLQYSFFLLFFSIGVYAQSDTEMNDSLNLLDRSSELQIYRFDATFFEMYYPQSGTFNTNREMERQFFQMPEQLNSAETNYSIDSEFHYYYSPTFSLWRNTNPLYFGAALNTNRLFDWDKLNIFFDANGQMINNYEIGEKGYFVESEKSRAIFWQMGAGASYEVAPRKTIFIKSSALFRNSQFIGQRHAGGLNVKF